MALQAVPKRPDGIQPLGSRIITDKLNPYVTANGYTVGQQRVLMQSSDEVELELSFRAYDNMENDGTIIKSKRILLTNVLADDFQMSPGATAEQVGPDEHELYTDVMEFCERVIDGLDCPLRDTLEQHMGNAVKYGHGIAEIEWEYRLDSPATDPVPDTKPSKLTTALHRAKHWLGFTDTITAGSGGDIQKPILKNERTRLMPSSLKVKPRNATRFVVDDYMNVLGLVPTKQSPLIAWNEIIDREKFMVLTFGKQDEDPRGVSMYRQALNWYNLKTQIPSEMLRFILEESVPKAVGTLPKDMPAFEFERDDNGNIIYEDPDTKKIPKMLTGAESFKRQIEGFRSGGGAVIPYEATLKPFKTAAGSSDADLFPKILKTINDAMEESILLQTLAQSEGEHQARSAAQQVAEILYNLIFWLKWKISMMVLMDLLAVAVRVNFGDWAVRYLPQVSLGDFARRDWIAELEAYADAYFKGFIDDSQRPELMALMNLPKPGESRQEANIRMGIESGQTNQDVNGNPITPNNKRPDKQAGTQNRNAGNGTEKKKKNARTKTTGFGPSNVLGHHTGWFRRHTGNIRASGR